jgi:hypothetical protein
MYAITIVNRIIVLIVYITAGPTYILTFETSSLMRPLDRQYDSFIEILG